MTWIILIVIFIIGVYVISTYNSLVSLRNKVRDQWSQIDVVLKRRADLIPNLVETVKGIAKHEKETLNEVIEARNKFVNSKSTNEEMIANNELSGALSRLLVSVEAYPDLKANTNFLDLQNQLKETEDRITYSRQFYNDSVLKFQNKIESFPSNIIASLFKFEPFKFFEANDKDKENPEVKF